MGLEPKLFQRQMGKFLWMLGPITSPQMQRVRDTNPLLVSHTHLLGDPGYLTWDGNRIGMGRVLAQRQHRASFRAWTPA